MLVPASRRAASSTEVDAPTQIAGCVMRSPAVPSPSSTSRTDRTPSGRFDPSRTGAAPTRSEPEDAANFGHGQLRLDGEELPIHDFLDGACHAHALSQGPRHATSDNLLG